MLQSDPCLSNCHLCSDNQLPTRFCFMSLAYFSLIFSSFEAHQNLFSFTFGIFVACQMLTLPILLNLLVMNNSLIVEPA